MVTEPVIPAAAKTIMTNSGKYAHYGPGLTGRGMYFGSLAGCVEAACSGTYEAEKPGWLQIKGLI
jgi:predicted aconitase